MGKRRKGSQIIKEIIKTLQENPKGLSLRSLESKIDTNTETIKDYTTLLSELNIINLKQTKKGNKTITKVILK